MLHLPWPAQRSVSCRALTVGLRGPCRSVNARASAGSSLGVAAQSALAHHHVPWHAVQTVQSRAVDWMSQWQSARRKEQVRVSEDRLEEMLRAEVEYLALDTSYEFSLQNVLESSTVADLALLIHQELSKIFARQMLRIERTTPEWRTVPGMVETHRIFWRSFRNLRLADPHSVDSACFGTVIRNIQTQDKLLVPLLTQIAYYLEVMGIMGKAGVDAWLFSMLNSRVGVEMAMDHYINLKASSNEAHVGIVHTRCDPGKVCQEAIESIQAEFPEHGLGFKLHAEQPAVDFSFPSDYLYFIVEELLRNGARATLSYARQDIQKPRRDIEVTVSACTSQVVIKISDESGGAPATVDSLIGFGVSFRADIGGEGPCVSGSGMGLPFCKLYTEHLGGSLHFMSRPGVGTDVFVYLPRIPVHGVSG